MSKQHTDDDGRTIADMSALDSVFGPQDSQGDAKFDQQGRPRATSGYTASARDIREELGDSDSRRALIFGATWAGLSIGLVYVVVFAIVIALMVLAWN